MPQNSEKEKKFEVEEREASKLADGIAGATVGVAKTIEEVATAPIRIVGRTIDGTIQGVKHGIDTSRNPLESATKPVVSGIIGTVKGAVKGIEASAKQVGEGLNEIGENISKVGKTLAGKES